MTKKKKEEKAARQRARKIAFRILCGSGSDKKNKITNSSALQRLIDADPRTK